jgi:hypothetical protein
MVKINLQNVEELLFKNADVVNTLHDLRHIFDKWLMGYRLPLMSSFRLQAKIDLLNYIDDTHIEKLAKIFNDIVFVEKLNYHIVKNLYFSLDYPIENELVNHSLYEIALYRTKDEIYLTLWR